MSTVCQIQIKMQFAEHVQINKLHYWTSHTIYIWALSLIKYEPVSVWTLSKQYLYKMQLRY